MLGFLDRLFRRRSIGSSRPSPPPKLPSLPAGWRIVPYGSPGVIAYEATGFIPQGSQQAMGFGMDMVGTNATAFHGFPPETLEIGKVDVRMEFGVGYRLKYTLLYHPEGARKPGSLVPSFDYHRLPLGNPTASEAPAHASA